VRAIVQQQNQFNYLTVRQLEEVAERFEDLNGRLLAQDKEQSALIHDVGQLTAQLIQTNRLLKSIDERLARLEDD
jgi:predicted nuclease with TOPRIM domain